MIRDVSHGPEVALAALHLLDPETGQVMDADRWQTAVELSRLLLNMGHRPSWWQIGPGWKSQVIPGVPLFGQLRSHCQLLTYPWAAEDFLHHAGQARWVLYFDFILGYPQVHPRSMALAWSMDWAHPLHESQLATPVERAEWRRRIWMSLQAPLRVVTPDAGFIHWATATWPGLEHQFVYIPHFSPSLQEEVGGSPAEPRSAPGRMRVLFPGPLTPEGGIAEIIRVVDRFHEKPASPEFLITGRGTRSAEQYLSGWVRHRPRCSFRPDLPLEKALDLSDVVVFPVKTGAGPTAACLAAMAAGKVVAVSQTSGLADLILDGHSGLVIRPEHPFIVDTLESVAGRPDARTAWGRFARDTVRNAYSRDTWERRWRTCIRQFVEGDAL